MGKMKFQFESDLDFQTEAVNAVVGLFKNQPSKKAFFTVNGQSGFDYIDFTKDQPKDDKKKYGLGVANKLTLSSYEILDNLRKVQQLNKIAPAEFLNENEYDFNIEMETGTGKTYVYLKTIFELNKEYGFSKFIIVVPSIAIKEGVYKTIQITKEHFKEEYENVIYDSFVYDRSKLEQIRNFAVNSNIQIMIINIDSFNRSFKDPSKEDKANIIHRENDKLSGYKPIQLIQETNPIVIIDEPQSVMGGKGEEAVANLNPLCTLRYSATHKNIQNLIYKLDAIDAYERHLVKGIEVAELEADEFHNKPYMKLISVSHKGNKFSAKIEVDVMDNGEIKRKPITVKQSDELSEFKLTNRSIYDGYTVQHIHCVKGEEYVSFTNKNEILTIGDPVNSVNEMTFKRAQINKTIEEHLDKEKEYNKKGIKVLSLFFIDKVSKYRDYDENGNPIKGIYAKMFEEEYAKVIKYPKYHWTDDVDVSLKPEDVHEGYFSIDKNKSKKAGRNIFKDTRTTKKGKVKYNNDDEDTFNLIMRDKERLLSFEEPVKFIFSHSALREGWDNPNVFQICTLNESNSNIKKRQEIGRGLRLCVNQDGERIKDNSINRLTIMANESYEEFAKALQTEMEKETGIKFGVIERDTFAHLTIKNKNGEFVPIENQGSLSIFNKFKEMHYIDKKGKVQEALKTAIEKDNVVVPERFESIRDQITEVAKQRAKQVKPKRAKQRKKAEFKEKVELSPEFKKLWNTIRRKTTYSVEFSTPELIEKCKGALQEGLNIKSPKLFYTKNNLVINAAGVSVDEKGKLPPSPVYSNDEEIALPDIVTILQNETSLTRKTIIQILVQSKTLEQFKKNPQDYIDESIKIIKSVMSQFLIDGIKYTQLDECYSQTLFTDDELSGYLDQNMISVENSVYDYVVYDSEIEKNFAMDLDSDPQVCLYAKLPDKFKISTPIGGYNPDWAILFREDSGLHKLYFVVETKGTDDIESLRPAERNKILCGIKHFKAIDENIKFSVTDKYNKFKRKDVF